MALGLAQAGADVVGVDYIETPETKELIEKEGSKFVGITANLLSTQPIKGIVETAVKEFGHIDILVNNAGIIRREDALEFSEKDWDDVMNINIKTLFFLSQAVANQFVKQGDGGKIYKYCVNAFIPRRYQSTIIHSIKISC